MHGNEKLLEVTLIGHLHNIKSSKLKFELLCVNKLIKINFFLNLSLSVYVHCLWQTFSYFHSFLLGLCPNHCRLGFFYKYCWTQKKLIESLTSPNSITHIYERCVFLCVISAFHCIIIYITQFDIQIGKYFSLTMKFFFCYCEKKLERNHKTYECYDITFFDQILKKPFYQIIVT